MNRFALVVVVVGVGVQLLATACGHEVDEAVVAPAPGSLALPSVEVIAAAGATVDVAGRVVVAGSRSAVAAPVIARVRRLLVLPGDVVEKRAGVVEVVLPGAAEALADLDGASARRDVVVKRRAHLETLRREGLPDVRAELVVDGDIAELEGIIARAKATLAVAGVGSGDVDGLRHDGGVVLRAPSAGVVAAVGAVVGAVVEPGAVLAEIAAATTSTTSTTQARVLVRTAAAVAEGDAVLVLVDRRVPLKALASVAGIDPRDGARDRWFVVDGNVHPARGDDLAAILVDGAAVTVALPVRDAARVPASAVRLQADGRAVVVVIDAAGPAVRTVSVIGRLGDDVLLDPVGGLVGVRVAKEVRTALLRVEQLAASSTAASSSATSEAR